MCEHCGCGDHAPAVPVESAPAARTPANIVEGIASAAADARHLKAGGAHRDVVLEERVLAKNDATAAANRRWLEERGVVALNLISSPGSGKTLLLEKTLDRLRGRVPCAVITGDQQTDLDACRLSGKGAHVHGLQTGSACHLDAEQIGALLPHVVDAETRLLFIENVGNLVCPAVFDLGESFKVALLSTPEGADKPLKYPALFARAGVVVVNKIDLAPYVGWDAALCRRNLRRVHPGVFVFELSAMTGAGLEAWIEYLIGLVEPAGGKD
jgi:hydrogenase nickel incorporation protein HypB